jgi:hypothetical protein
LFASGDSPGSMNVTPAGALAGAFPIRIGSRTPSRASRPAASSTRASSPSGNTILRLRPSLRSRSI